MKIKSTPHNPDRSIVSVDGCPKQKNGGCKMKEKNAKGCWGREREARMRERESEKKAQRQTTDEGDKE